MALRGHASIQGSTDIPTLFNLLPGYLPMPHAHQHLAGRLLRRRRGHRWVLGQQARLHGQPAQGLVGRRAQPENDFCFDYLPRIDGDHSSYRTISDMIAGKVPGYFLVGRTRRWATPTRMNRLGLANLEWLVVRDLQEIESASFWYDAPEIETGELVTEQIATEVFLMPAASHVEKEGTFTQTQRMLQWRDKAVEPPGDARSDLWFYYHLGRILRERLKDSTDPRDRPLLDLTWDYPTHGETADPGRRGGAARDQRRRPGRHGAVELHADEGRRLDLGRLLDLLRRLRRRGEPGRPPQAAPGAERGGARVGLGVAAQPPDPLHRASADPEGRPWSERKKYVWWDEEAGRWTGEDVPDFEATKRPDYVPRTTPGPGRHRRRRPVRHAERRQGLAVRAQGRRRRDRCRRTTSRGSRRWNPLYGVQSNPTKEEIRAPWNRTHPPHSDVFPYAFTTYRLTEHHTAGR